MNTAPQELDIIGDVHGHASRLTALLDTLGYSESAGVWSHATRKAVFVGDFIDRGPDIPRTLAIVSRMVRAGSAWAVLGNHELDALRYAVAPDEHRHLRVQLEDTHRQFQGKIAEWGSYLDWFRKLPFALDFGAVRIVHACWNDDAIASLGGFAPPYSDEALRRLLDSETKEGRAIKLLTEGIRLTLPDGLHVLTSRLVPLNWMRMKWWLRAEGAHYDDLAFPHLEVVPHEPAVLPPEQGCLHRGLFDGYAADAPPVFFGHYSLPKDADPAPMAKNVACVDYGIWKGGPLVAYRWSGEGKIISKNFVTT